MLGIEQINYSFSLIQSIYLSKADELKQEIQNLLQTLTHKDKELNMMQERMKEMQTIIKNLELENIQLKAENTALKTSSRKSEFHMRTLSKDQSECNAESFSHNRLSTSVSQAFGSEKTLEEFNGKQLFAMAKVRLPKESFEKFICIIKDYGKKKITKKKATELIKGILGEENEDLFTNFQCLMN